MATSIIPQNVLAGRIEAPRARIARVAGLLSLAIRAAQELEVPTSSNPNDAEVIEQALQIAHDLLDDVHGGLEPTDLVLFKREDAEEVRS